MTDEKIINICFAILSLSFLLCGSMRCDGLKIDESEIVNKPSEKERVYLYGKRK